MIPIYGLRLGSTVHLTKVKKLGASHTAAGTIIIIIAGGIIY